jgi:hypothetical protein
VDIHPSLASFQFFLILWKSERDNVTPFQLSAGSPAGGVTQLHAFQQLLLLFQKRFYEMPASPQGFCLVFHSALYLWYNVVMSTFTGFTSLVDRMVYMYWLVL